jgi:hypothetical protein
MAEQSISRVVERYGLTRRRRKQLLLGAFILVVAAAEVCLVLFGLRGQTLADRAGVAASLLTADAILLAWWQWRAQRREVALEAYFARLDLPNQRRLAYYEQVLALGDAAGNAAVATALEQFYLFYVYAELDNLEYALTKYADGDMSAGLAERAVQTFLSRCRQSADFRERAGQAVAASGYSATFEALVRDLLARCTAAGGAPAAGEQPPHPMRFNELDVVRTLRRA